METKYHLNTCPKSLGFRVCWPSLHPPCKNVVGEIHSWIKPKLSLDQEIREILNQSRLTNGLTRLRMD